MKGGSDWYWIVIILLFQFIEPLREIVWSSMLFADPFVLIVLLLAVWYWGRY